MQQSVGCHRSHIPCSKRGTDPRGWCCQKSWRVAILMLGRCEIERKQYHLLQFGPRFSSDHPLVRLPFAAASPGSDPIYFEGDVNRRRSYRGTFRHFCRSRQQGSDRGYCWVDDLGAKRSFLQKSTSSVSCPRHVCPFPFSFSVEGERRPGAKKRDRRGRLCKCWDNNFWVD